MYNLYYILYGLWSKDYGVQELRIQNTPQPHLTCAS
jgi:hypothetical protein